MDIKTQEIPAIIANLRDHIKTIDDTKNIRFFRTMIGMAEDAYKLKTLDDIKDFDSELQLDKKPVYNSMDGIIYRDGNIYTADYNEDESKMLIRDIEGIIIDVLFSQSIDDKSINREIRNNAYKNWNYMEKN